MNREAARYADVAQGVLDALGQIGAIGKARERVVMGHDRRSSPPNACAPRRRAPCPRRRRVRRPRCARTRRSPTPRSSRASCAGRPPRRNPSPAPCVRISSRNWSRRFGSTYHSRAMSFTPASISASLAVAVELHEGGIGAKLTAVKGRAVDADDGILEQAAIFGLRPLERFLLLAMVRDVREGAHGAAVLEHGGTDLENRAVRATALVNGRRFEDAAGADPARDVLAHAAEFADRPLVFDNLLKMQGIGQYLSSGSPKDRRISCCTAAHNDRHRSSICLARHC